MFTRARQKLEVLDRVMVATDDRRIVEAVRAFGGEVMMTATHHASGTDRLAEVARKIKADWLVNVQGDLPFIHAATITRAVRPLRRDRTLPMGTVCTAIFDEAEWRESQHRQGSHGPQRLRDLFYPGADSLREKWCASIPRAKPYARASKRRLWGYRHLGLYVYRRDFLLKFARLRPTPLEQIESLEQLRAVGKTVIGYYVALVDEKSVEVDTPADLQKRQSYT